VKDELHLQVQKRLDEGQGLTADDALTTELEAAGPEARAEAESLARLDAGLRGFADVELSDDAADAIATRIEQRLDEDLARIPDPVAPPIFGDKDGQPPKTETPKPKRPAAKGGTSTGDYSLANLTGLSVQNAPVVKPDAPLKRPPQKKPAPIRLSQAELVTAEDVGLTEVVEDEQRPLSGAAPPVPPAARMPLPKTDDRASIPSVAPFDLGGAAQAQDLPPPPVDLEARRRRNRTLFYVGTSLAAAAAVLVVVVTGISTMGMEDAEPVASMAAEPVAASEAELAADPFPAEAAPPSAARPGQGARTTGVSAFDQADDNEASTVEVQAEATEEAMIAAAEPEPEADSEGAGAERVERRSMGLRLDTPTMAHAPAPADRPRMARSRMGSAMTSPPAMMSGGGATPSRTEVVRALQAVQPQVAACAGGRGGVVTVNVTVGGSGRVRNAQVTGEYQGTREGSCVARAVRRARFPEFRQDSFSVRYPFRL